MDPDVAQRMILKEMGDRIRYVVERRKQVANVCVSSGMSDKDSVVILGKVTDYITTHLGRNAYGTTRYKTCRIADYKHRKGRRRDHTQHTFAHIVDLHRTWTHYIALFKPGGRVWSKMGRSEKRRMRCAVSQAEAHLRTYGDYVGAYDIIRGK